MIDNFPQFRDALKANFDRLVSTNPPIFQVDIDKNAFYQLYQNSFPDGTNPMYRVRREYDCSCCHHFINQVGSIVIWNGGRLFKNILSLIGLKSANQNLMARFLFLPISKKFRT